MDHIKYYLTITVGLIAAAAFALSISGVISGAWLLPSLLVALGAATLLGYFSIPSAEEKQKELAEYGKQLLEADGYTFEKTESNSVNSEK